MKSHRYWLLAIIVGCLPLGAQSNVAPDQGASNKDWPYLGGSAEGKQFSSLNEINAATVDKLGLLWAASMPIKDGLVGNPIVRGGMVYQSAPRGVVFANSVNDGKLIWQFAPDLDLSKATLTALYGVNNNRGLAVDEERVYVTSGNCQIFAIDRITGQQVWHAQSCDPTQDQGIITAPRVGGGMVFVGNNNHELGTARGFLDAYDAKTGQHAWRVYTVPGDPSQPYETPQLAAAAKTWGPNYWKTSRGGAAPWEGMVYDSKTDLLLFGTGNPGSHAPEDVDRELLYSDSLIAVNAKTGKYVWHFQMNQGDVWDFGDATAHNVIADLRIKGKMRHVVMQAAKNGYFYVFDVATGQLISAKNYVPQINYSGMDPKTGRLTVREEVKYWKRPGQVTVGQPGGWGAHTWTLMSFNPQTGLAYIPAFIFPNRYDSICCDENAGIPAEFRRHGRLVAWDPIRQSERWHVDETLTINGGVLSTAGNLVFQGTGDGMFTAYAADTGKKVWSFNTHSVILAGPSTVSVGNQQVILVPAGDGGAAVTVKDDTALSTTPFTLAPSRLLAFGLGGSMQLPAPPPKVLGEPIRPKQPDELAAAGEKIYRSNSCTLCHGPAAVTGGSHVPDLRMIQEARFNAMPQILRNGALKQLGMPQFAQFSEDDVRALQAYIINCAWAGYDAQQLRH